MKHALLALSLVAGPSTGCAGRNGHDATLPVLVAAGAVMAGAFLLAGKYDTTPDECTAPAAGCVTLPPGAGLPTDDL